MQRTFVVLLASCVLLGGGVALAASLTIAPQRLTTQTSASSVPVSTCSLSAAADTYADADLLNKDVNYGTATELHVKSLALADKRSFLRFDLTPCSIPSGARIKTARLDLFLAAAPSTTRTYEVRRVTAAWGETTLTSSNQPGVAASATATASTGTTSNVTVAWSVAGDLQAFVDGTAINNGWRLADQSEGALLAEEGKFSSREHATASQRPSLTVTYYP